MKHHSISRRRLLQAAGAVSLATHVPTRAAGAHSLVRTLDLDDPEDALTAMVKMRASLLPEDCPNWYFGTIYGVLPGKAPVATTARSAAFQYARVP